MRTMQSGLSPRMTLEGCPVHDHPTLTKYPPIAIHQNGDYVFVTSFFDNAKKVAESMEPGMAKAFTDAVRGIQDRINMGKLRAALAGGNITAIEDVAGIGAFKALSQDGNLLRTYSRTVTATGESTAALVSELTDMEFQFNFRDPNVVRKANLFSGKLIADDVLPQARRAIQVVIAAGADLGISPVEQARAIRQVVGLPSNWANAPMNLRAEISAGHAGAATGRRLSATDKAQIRSRIRKGTVDEAFLNEMEEKYARSLVSRRAQNIARTETLRAAHSGQQFAWEQAMDQGVLPTNTKRFWIVTIDSQLSEEHAMIPSMNPEGRGMQEYFQTPEGAFLQPPSRTNCRCGIGLMFPAAASGGTSGGGTGPSPRPRAPKPKPTPRGPRVPVTPPKPKPRPKPKPEPEPAPTGTDLEFPQGGFASNDEAREWAEKRWPNRKHEFEGWDAQNTSSVLATLDDLERQFPGFMADNRLTYVGSQRASGAAKVGQEWAEGFKDAMGIYQWSSARTHMAFNPGYMRRVGAIERVQERSIKAGWLSPAKIQKTGDGARVTAIHEFGHHLDLQLKLRGKTFAFKEQEDAYRAAAAARDKWKKKWSGSSNLPSQYAKTDPAEAFAEMFSYVMNNPATPDEGSIMSEFRKIIALLKEIPE